MKWSRRHLSPFFIFPNPAARPRILARATEETKIVNLVSEETYELAKFAPPNNVWTLEGFYCVCPTNPPKLDLEEEFALPVVTLVPPKPKKGARPAEADTEIERTATTAAAAPATTLATAATIGGK